MNIEELNNCFDSMTPTKEQKDRMLAAVMNAKEQPVKVVNLNRYKYMSAAAAVVAIGVFAAAYSNMGKEVIEHDTFSPEIAVEENSQKKVEDVQEVVEPKYSVGSVEDGEGENAVQNSAVVEDKQTENKNDSVVTSNSTDFSTMLKEEYPELADTKKTENNKTANEDNLTNNKTDKSETAKIETVKDETEKNEIVKSKTNKEETVKVETPKTENTKDKTTKDETPKQETVKTESTKTEEKIIDESDADVVSEDSVSEESKVREMPVPTETSDENPIVNDEVSHTPQVAVNDSETDLYGIYDGNAIGGGSSGGAASSGGGGGGSSGGAAAVTQKSITLSQIKNDEVYSELFPTAFVNGFTFTGAYETKKIMEAHFETKDGRYMSVAVVENGKYNVYQQIVTPSQILDMPADGYVEFAVKCGNYYVIYYVETDSASEVYEMVTSSAYFK